MLNGESRQPWAAKIGPSRNGRQASATPRDAGEPGDPHGRRVGIRARKLVPELRRRHRASPARSEICMAERRGESQAAKKTAPSGDGAARFISRRSATISSSGLPPARRARPAPSSSSCAMCFLCFVMLRLHRLLRGHRVRVGSRAAAGAASVWARAASGDRTRAALRPMAAICLEHGVFSNAGRPTRSCLHDDGCAFADELAMNGQTAARTPVFAVV